MKVIWEPSLQAEMIQGDVERATLCQRSRGFKATIEKERKHEEMLDTIANCIGQLLTGALIFGGMAVALYFGSI